MPRALCLAVLAALASATLADPITLPNTLSNNTPADANAVQANFDVLASESNEDDARIGALELNITLDEVLGNFGVGLNALASSPTGFYNTAAGPSALRDNTSGDYNTAVGTDALLESTTGNENTAVGSEALRANSTGGQNTATGAAAMFNNTVGSSNTATGYHALLNNTEGSENTAVGVNALQANSVSGGNTALGFAALNKHETNSDNTAIGKWALRDQTAGRDNVAVGAQAMLLNATGSRNTVVGFGAALGNSSGITNVAVGYQALLFNQTGSSNVAIGSVSGPANGFADLSNTIAIGRAATVTASNTIRLGNDEITGFFSQVSLTTTSDKRLKEAIEPIDSGLALINDLRPVTYHRINNSGDDFEMGLLAQEVHATLQQHGLGNAGMVLEPADGSPMSLRYSDLFAPLIRAVQELSDASKDKDAQIAGLRQQILDQQAELFALVRGQQEHIARLEAMMTGKQLAAR